MSEHADPAPEASEIAGPPERRVINLEIDLSRLPSATTAIGMALAGAAIAMAAIYTRMHGGFDHSVFIVGVLAAAGLLAVSAGAQLVRPDLDRQAALVSWPGAAGAAGAGVLLAVLVNNEYGSFYGGAGLALVISVAGYLLSRGGPFVVTTIAALAILYVEACSQVLDFGSGKNAPMIAGTAALLFIVLVTALGWLLPATRVLSAMVVGVGGLYLISSGLGPFFLFSAVAFGGPEGEYGGPRHNPYVNDIWVLLFYAAVLVLMWTFCSLATGFVGFRILTVLLTVFAVPLATLGLAIGHPTWWEVVLTGAGGALLIAAGFRSISSRP
jgi:hypothetical protein